MSARKTLALTSTSDIKHFPHGLTSATAHSRQRSRCHHQQQPRTHSSHFPVLPLIINVSTAKFNTVTFRIALRGCEVYFQSVRRLGSGGKMCHHTQLICKASVRIMGSNCSQFLHNMYIECECVCASAFLKVIKYTHTKSSNMNLNVHRH